MMIKPAEQIADFPGPDGIRMGRAVTRIETAVETQLDYDAVIL